MKAQALWVVGTALLCGCVSIPRESPAETRKRDEGQYGTGIVRPGMTKADVDALLRWPAEPMPYVVGGQYHDCLEFRYSDLVVNFRGFPTQNSPELKVTDCRVGQVVEEGGQAAALTDEQLRGLLSPGQSPAEVAGLIGPPAVGYENDPGVVVTVHPQPGIAVRYTDSRLKDWWRHHEYRPARPRDGQPPSP